VPLFNCNSLVGIVKDYFIALANKKIYWCSSSTWVFSELPKCVEESNDVDKLKSVNSLFTGEFDSVLFPATGAPTVVDAESGIQMQPKPLTELDRLSYVVGQLRSIFVCPKNRIKFVPTGEHKRNEAFRGLSKEDCFKLDCWQFMRPPQDEQIKGKIARGEAVYSTECLDNVANDMPKNAWSIQGDVTGTLASIKSHLWPGFMAYHKCNTNISGFFYFGDGIRNSNLAFMV